MDSTHHFYAIEKEAVAEYKDRGSRFLAYAFPITSTEDFKKRWKALKEEHPKAVHHCYAYRIGTEGTDYRANDDGEPSGTAGKPILGQLDSKGLVNAAVVVVRYFGGTLLGVPGLINAYKTVTSLCLQLTPIIQKPVLEVYIIQFDYTLMNELMMVVKRFGCVVVEREAGLFCSLKLGIPKGVEGECIDAFKNLYGVTIVQ